MARGPHIIERGEKNKIKERLKEKEKRGWTRKLVKGQEIERVGRGAIGGWEWSIWERWSPRKAR